MSEPPVGTITFLFTDLVTSTRLWEQQPDAMRAALAEHDAILRGAVERNGGYVVKSTGDGVHAALDSAHAGLLAAVEAQRALLTHEWSEATGPLRVRMGLHSGEAELRNGDYFGPAVNRAARIMAAGNGGQILCSSATAGLVEDEPLAGIELIDLGEHRLRDLARPDRLYQVGAAGLARAFPPLATLDAAPGNLPTQITSFIGRRDDLAGVGAALEDARLVTLTGVGGVGKTRLALEVAGAARHRFADGIWWCELAPAGDGDSLVQVVAAALGVARQPGMSLQASIVDLLRARTALLAFDNCEHLHDHVGTLSETILSECPMITILATSREALAIEGERVWPLRSLGLPEADSGFEQLETSDAVRLFVDRVREVQPQFVIEEGNAAAVVEICRRLDGIPLALVLAAARAASMSPVEIAGHLDERFRLLTGGRRHSVERHRTLRGTIDWSYSLLTPVEQAIFARLSVLAGSFDADFARAVVIGGDIEEWDFLDAIASLVAKSMLTTDDASAGTTRYRMLETLRQYAEDRLEEIGEADHWRRRLAQRSAQFAEEAGAGLRSRSEPVWRLRLWAELDNLRAALTWALDREGEDAELGVQIVSGLAWEGNSGDLVGVTAWAERALDAARRSTPGRRADVLSAASWAALNRGDVDAALARVHEALEGGLPPDATAPCIPFVILGYARLITGNLEGAIEAAEEGLRALAATGQRELANQVVLRIASVGWRFFAGDVERARADATEAVALARELGAATQLSMSLFILVVTFWRDDPVRARPLLDEALGLVESGAATGPMHGLMLAVRSRLCLMEGDSAGACAALRAGLETIRNKGDQPGLVTLLGYAIPTLWELGALETAAVVAGAAYRGPLAWLRNVPPPEERAAAAAMVAIREELGESEYEVALARGATMSSDEVSRCLLTELDRQVAAALG